MTAQLATITTTTNLPTESRSVTTQAMVFDPSLSFQDLTQAHIKELCSLRTDAKMAAETFSEAILAQAKKCGLSRSALRKYICARVDDRLKALDTEANDISHLLETAQ